MIAADFLCRAEGAPPLARMRRSAAVSGRSRRKPRSQSSPVRIGTASPDGRARSPSVSPPRVSPERALARAAAATPYPRSHGPLATLPSLEHRHHLVKQRAGLSCSSAYFSLRPPAVPVRLVCGATGAPPAITPVGPLARAVPPPPPLRSAAEEFPLPAQDYEPQQVQLRESGGKCRRMVRRLLAELLAALPLAAPLAVPLVASTAALAAATSAARSYDTRTNKTALPPMSSYSRAQLAPAAPVGPVAPAARAPDSRSVAVQALAVKRSTDDDDLFYSFDESVKEGWVGGVRALRDSHVRLVLRQLRHIERLNRALDRAARPPPALVAAAASTARLQRSPRPL